MISAATASSIAASSASIVEGMCSTPPGSGSNGSRMCGLPVRASDAHRAAVERVDEREDARARAARVVQAGELERRLVRLGAGVAEPDAPALARAGEAHEPLGELELRARSRSSWTRARASPPGVATASTNTGMRVAERVHGDAGEEVEVLACPSSSQTEQPSPRTSLRERHADRAHHALVEPLLPRGHATPPSVAVPASRARPRCRCPLS